MGTKKKDHSGIYNDFESSNIEQFEYEQRRQRLGVTFTNGSVYIYKGVPFEKLKEVLDSDSVGAAFNKIIKQGDYEFQKA